MVVYALEFRFAKWACDRPTKDADFNRKKNAGKYFDITLRFWQKKNIFSDEAHFDLGGYINNQNSRIWGTENPNEYIEKPTHPK